MLYRAMKEEDGCPLVARSARALGVRVDTEPQDVHPDGAGDVSPGEGMSVAPDDPMLLDQHRRPGRFGGTGKDPVWEIVDESLNEDLDYIPDRPDHGMIGPAAKMPLLRYEDALAATVDDWKLTP
jgi:hypothetical protein